MGLPRVFQAINWSYLYEGGGSSDYDNFNRVDSVFAYAMQTDYHYYQFHRSAERYFDADEGFPLAEAVYIYSNIRGGLGVFAGYNKRVYFWAATPQGDD
ncbi:MAG: DUF4249 family protein [Bacteroidales bacterium]